MKSSTTLLMIFVISSSLGYSEIFSQRPENEQRRRAGSELYEAGNSNQRERPRMLSKTSYPVLPHYNYYTYLFQIPSGTTTTPYEAAQIYVYSETTAYIEKYYPNINKNTDDYTMLVTELNQAYWDQAQNTYQAFQTTKSELGIDFTVNLYAPVTITHPTPDTTTITTATTQPITIPVQNSTATVPTGTPASITIAPDGSKTLTFYNSSNQPVAVVSQSTQTTTLLQPVTLSDGTTIPPGTYSIPH
jgi:hypothetical protein